MRKEASRKANARVDAQKDEDRSSMLNTHEGSFELFEKSS